MSSLKNSIAVLAATTPPPLKEKMQALADVNARIAALETELGLPHKLPTLNTNRAQARLVELESQRAGKSVAAKLPPLPLPASLAAAIASTAESLADDGILKTTFAEYQRMSPDHRLQFTRDGGSLGKSDFDKLSPTAKTAFCVNGGKIAEDRKFVKNPSGMGGRWE